MKKVLIKLAVIACLAGPLVATADPITTVYLGSSDNDTYTFALDQLATVSIGYSWYDMRLTKNGGSRYYDALSLNWTLNGPISLSGTFVDTKDVDEVIQGVLSLGNLDYGDYTLSLFGTWASVTLNGNGNADFVRTAGRVDLSDSFSAIRVTSSLAAGPASSVPEPPTSAIIMVGLGLISAMRRRRKEKRD